MHVIKSGKWLLKQCVAMSENKCWKLCFSINWSRSELTEIMENAGAEKWIRYCSNLIASKGAKISRLYHTMNHLKHRPPSQFVCFDFSAQNRNTIVSAKSRKMQFLSVLEVDRRKDCKSLKYTSLQFWWQFMTKITSIYNTFFVYVIVFW